MSLYKERLRNEKGQVAVLYHPSFGGGWSTWKEDADKEKALFHVEIAALYQEIEQLEKLDSDLSNRIVELKLKAIKIAERDFPGQHNGPVEELSIEWIQEGCSFRVKEYDGLESIEPQEKNVYRA